MNQFSVRNQHAVFRPGVTGKTWKTDVQRCFTARHESCVPICVADVRTSPCVRSSIGVRVSVARKMFAQYEPRSRNATCVVAVDGTLILALTPRDREILRFDFGSTQIVLDSDVSVSGD